MDRRGTEWFGSSAVADERRPGQRCRHNDRLPERCGGAPGMSRSSCNTFRHPNFGAYHARLEKLLTLAGAGRPCWSAYARPVAHVRRELTPCWHDKRATLVAEAVCHKNHQNGIDASTIVIDTSTTEPATSAAPPTAPARRDGFIVFSVPGGMNARAVRPIMKQIRRALWAATKQQVEPEEASQMLEVIRQSAGSCSTTVTPSSTAISNGIGSTRTRACAFEQLP